MKTSLNPRLRSSVARLLFGVPRRLPSDPRTGASAGGSNLSAVCRWTLLTAVLLLRSSPGAAQPVLEEKRTTSHFGYLSSWYKEQSPLWYGHGASFYSPVWPLLESPLDGFQVGLPGIWIVPENQSFTEALCPPGTYSRDKLTDRGPIFRDVFQTVEGGVGFWGSTQFKTRSPKYRMNGTPDCYNGEISSPGWGFGNPESLPSDQMGIAQLSNRLLIPPDGMTFAPGMRGELFGTAWMSLPLMDDEQYFLLTTRAHEAGNQFVEGNEVVPGATLGGASFLNHAPDVNSVPGGMLWKMVPLPDGYFALTTAFLEKKGYYLECNRPGEGSFLFGISFMDKGDPSVGLSSGQQWKLIPQTDGYFGLTTRFLESQSLFWTAVDSTPLDAPAMLPVGGTSGLAANQRWRLVPYRNRKPSPGPNSWTLFANARNFRGPVAFWLPETWTRLANTYPTIQDRGLDARGARPLPGAMEFNTLPYFEGNDASGNKYVRIPRIQFPLAKSGLQGVSYMMEDLVHYSSSTLYESVWAWLRGAGGFVPAFNAPLGFKPPMDVGPIQFELVQGANKLSIPGFGSLVGLLSFTQSPGTFALSWNNQEVDILADYASFPEYFKREGDTLVPVKKNQVPDSTGLQSQTFRPGIAGRPYVASGSQWTTPGRTRVGGEVTLTDGTLVTYDWYRFVDQPSLQHLNLAADQKARLQAAAEKIHADWTPDREYLPAPTRGGSLASLDSALLVTPPSGLEHGYVPVVTGQRLPHSLLQTKDLEGIYRRTPVENDWHTGELLRDSVAAGKFRWRNDAKVSWLLTPDLPQGGFIAGPETPYPGSVQIVLVQDGDGRFLPRVRGIVLAGEFYERISGPGSPKLAIRSIDRTTVQLSWEGSATLQRAPTPSGPWSAAGATASPFNANSGDKAWFYRLIAP